MTLSEWADLAMIVLVIQGFIGALVVGIVLFFAMRALLEALRWLRRTFPGVRGRFAQAAHISSRASQRIAAPFIAGSAAQAQVRGWLHALGSLFSQRPA